MNLFLAQIYWINSMYYVRIGNTYDSNRFNFTMSDTYLVFASKLLAAPYTLRNTPENQFWKIC